VTDPGSGLHPFPVHGPAGGSPDSVLRDDDCDVAALAGVEVLDPSGGVTYGPSSEAVGCFEADGGSFVAVTGVGEGTVVAVGGAGPFTNEVLDERDNAVLAASLLAPRPGTRVAFVRPPVPGSGGEGLLDLVGGNVWSFLWQLGVAFVLYALWRARRLGRPVPERRPVELSASELVVAVGNLLQQAGRRDQAGRLLGDDLRRRLAERLGLSSTAPAEEVAEVAAARTGFPAERLRTVLRPGPLPGDDDLVHLAAETETIRRELEDVR
jgi:hypothetical protein